MKTKHTSKNICLFNGDADGIVAVHLCQLAHISFEEKITGTKRETQLLKNVKEDKTCEIFAFDIGIEQNYEAILEKINSEIFINWFDHHISGKPQIISPFFNAYINIDKKINTSCIVAKYLGIKENLWCCVGLFGDGIYNEAKHVASSFNLDHAQIKTLSKIGSLFNYNGYGETISDLHYNPCYIVEQIKNFACPLTFSRENSLLSQLENAYKDDFANAASIIPEKGFFYHFPKEKWSNRIYGEFGHITIQHSHHNALAILIEKDNHTFMVSVRSKSKNVGEFCKLFSTGGGRAAAGGINTLPISSLSDFYDKFIEYFETK